MYKLFGSIVSSLLFIGCAGSSPVISFQSESLNYELAKSANVYIVNKSVGNDIFIDSMMMDYFRRSLKLNNYNVVGSLDSAEQVMVIRYEDGGGEVRDFTYSTNVYGVVGYSSQNSGQIRISGNTGNWNQSTVTTPIHGVVGQQQNHYYQTFYSHYISLYGFDSRGFNDSLTNLKWRVLVKSYSEISDFRIVAPFMFTVVENIGKRVSDSYVVLPFDKRYLYIRGSIDSVSIKENVRVCDSHEKAMGRCK
jgi:hypothetical protein